METRLMDGQFEFGTDGPKVIVVGVDGSPTSLHAGAYAMGLARRQRSKLIVVYVENTTAMAAMMPTTAGAYAESEDQLAAELRKQCDEYAAEAGVACEFVALKGNPYTELTRVADDNQADAMVVGSSSQAGHRFVGSLAVHLVRSGRWPVTVVP
jgi:nucleotide-binding universal stress UspA family protein